MKDLLPKIDSQDGEFQNGDPASGTQGTRVTAEWLNSVQAHLRDVGEEVKYLLLQAGLTPIPSKTTQIYEAIMAVINANRRNGNTTQKGEIQLTDSINMASSVFGASALAVKNAYDKAVEADNHAERACHLAESKQSPATTLAGYGIGDFKVGTSTGDANDCKIDGNYYFASGQNLPSAGAWHIAVMSGGQTNAIRQIARKANESKVQTRYFNGTSWSAWKDVGGDGLPVGSVLAFPVAVQNPQGFLKCDGSTFGRTTYPDLYRALGNSNKLPDLRRSNVGMTAYFATDKIPDGWIAFDEIKQEVTQEKSPELYKYLIEKYTSIDNVPKAEDRFLRNAHNGLKVGDVQLGSLIGADSIDGSGAFSPYVKAIKNTYQETVDQVGFDPLLTEEIGNGRDVVNNESSPDGSHPKTKKQYNAGLSWSVGTDKNTDLNDPIKNESNGNGHFVGVTRPKSLVLKLCIKAKNSFDEVVFWIKAFGAVENQGVLDVSSLAQEVQEYKQMSVNVDGKLDDIIDKVDDALEVINTPVTVWTGNQSQGNKITLSEPCFDSTIILYLQHSTSNNLNDTSEIEVVSFDMCSEIKDKDIKNRGQAKDGYCYKLHKQHNEYGSFYLYVDHTGKQITLSKLNNRLCKRIDLRY